MSSIIFLPDEDKTIPDLASNYSLKLHLTFAQRKVDQGKLYRAEYEVIEKFFKMIKDECLDGKY